MAVGVKVEPERVKKTKPKAYIVRFAFGGLITAFAGFLATKYGPAVGGLFLGFPAILPASLTLVKKHEGEEAAGDDALGAAAGSIAMVFFAALIWGLSTRWPAWLLLVVAMIVWLAISVLVWWLVRRIKE